MSLGFKRLSNVQEETLYVVESNLNVMAHVDARMGKWRGN